MSIKPELKNKQNINKEQIKKNNNTLFVLIPIFIGLFVLGLLYISRTSTITGKVLTSTDNKIILKDVKITLDNSKDIKNDSSGNYSFTGLSQGSHEIKFEKEGYETLVKSIEFKKGQEIYFDAYLSIYQDYQKISTNFTGLTAITSSNNVIRQLSEPKDQYQVNNGNVLQLNSNLYIINYKSGIINLLDELGNEIKKIEIPKGSIPNKLYTSLLKDKLYTIFENSNSIGVIDLSKNEFIKESFSLDSKIYDVFINKKNNRGYILTEKNIYLLNVINTDIKLIIPNNLRVEKLVFYKSFIFALDKINQELIKLDSYNMDKEAIKYKLNFIPENILVTNSEKVYISSGKNLYLVDPETGNTNKTIDTGVNIVNMKVSPQDDNIYISDNTEKIHIFDTKNDELLKDSITFKMPVKEVFFPE